MKKRDKNLIVIFYLIFIVLPLFTLFPTAVQGQDYEFRHQHYDSPYIIKSLEGKEMAWKVNNATGVFADQKLNLADLGKYYEEIEEFIEGYSLFPDENIQPGDLITFKVDEYFYYDLDEDEQLYDYDYIEGYEIDFKKESWAETEAEEESIGIGALYAPGDYGIGLQLASMFLCHPYSYFLVQRDWGTVAFYIDFTSYYWGAPENTDRVFDAKYRTEWWNWRLINTVTLEFKHNETNYDILKYSRAEGILLSRSTRVNADDGKYKGSLDVRLVSYSGVLLPSPWYWIILVSSIVALLAIVIITISLLIQRKKRIWRDIKEI